MNVPGSTNHKESSPLATETTQPTGQYLNRIECHHIPCVYPTLSFEPRKNKSMTQLFPLPRNHASKSRRAFPTPAVDVGGLELVAFESKAQWVDGSTWSFPDSNPLGIIPSNSKRTDETLRPMPRRSTSLFARSSPGQVMVGPRSFGVW